MATVPAAVELQGSSPVGEEDTAAAAASERSKTKGLIIAVFDQNKTVRDRILHPGPLNIVACLKQHCWDGCPLPDPHGTTNCDHRGASPVAEVHLLGPALIRQGALKDRGFDVVVFPGGSAKTQAKALQSKGMLAVRQFVESGGGYVGICAGAFLALAHYGRDRSLKLLNAHTVLPWKRGQAVLKHAFSPAAADLLLGLGPHATDAAASTVAERSDESPSTNTGPKTTTPSQSIPWTATPSSTGGDGVSGGTRCVKIRYHNGPLMMPGPRPPRWGRQERIFDTECVPDSACAAPPGAIEVLAVFMEDACAGKPAAAAAVDQARAVQASADQDPAPHSEAAESPHETQVGKGAIVRGVCGRGRVLLISSHPESTQDQGGGSLDGGGGNGGVVVSAARQEGPVSTSVVASGHDVIISAPPAQKTAAKALGAAGYGRIIQRAVAWAGGR